MQRVYDSVNEPGLASYRDWSCGQRRDCAEGVVRCRQLPV